jgi:hypothetical protein
MTLRGLGQTPLVIGIANAIAQMEGFNAPGTRPNVNNNPGDLISWSGVPTSNGFAQFPTPAAGWSALYQQVQLNINRGLTLNQFFAGEPGVYAGYAPSGSSGNNPQQYASFVAGQVGIDPNTPLNEFDPNTLENTAVSPTVSAAVATPVAQTCADGTQPASDGSCDDGSAPTGSVSLSDVTSGDSGGISLPLALGLAGAFVLLWMWFKD